MTLGIGRIFLENPQCWRWTQFRIQLAYAVVLDSVVYGLPRLSPHFFGLRSYNSAVDDVEGVALVRVAPGAGSMRRGMTRSRISEGFHRIGLVLAVPCAIAAVISLVNVWSNYREVAKLSGPALYRHTINVEGPGGIVADFPVGWSNYYITKALSEIAELPPNQREIALRERAADAWLTHEADLHRRKNDALVMLAVSIGIALSLYTVAAL